MVGPRYCEKKEKGAKDHDTWIKTPYLHEGEEPSYTFDINVNIRTGVPLGSVWAPSHKVKVRQDMDEAEIDLSPEEEKGGNRDFILRYTLQGEMIQSGLLLYPGKEEKFFLLMLQPPERVIPRLATSRELERMYERVKDILVKISFIQPENPEHWMMNIRRFLSRISLRAREVKIIRGVCRQIYWYTEQVEKRSKENNES